MRKQSDAPLREFVYLDEVSVFSLISSLGPVATEFTATESSSLTGELKGTTGISAGVLKSEINSRSESTQTQGTQVLRKATVQATFKELYGHEKGGFLLRPATDAPPDLRDARDVNAALERCREDDPHTRMGVALQTYGRMLAARYGKDTRWNPTLITEDIFPCDGTQTWATVEERRPPFEALTHRLRDPWYRS